MRIKLKTPEHLLEAARTVRRGTSFLAMVSKSLEQADCKDTAYHVRRALAACLNAAKSLEEAASSFERELNGHLSVKGVATGEQSTTDRYKCVACDWSGNELREQLTFRPPPPWNGLCPECGQAESITDYGMRVRPTTASPGSNVDARSNTVVAVSEASSVSGVRDSSVPTDTAVLTGSAKDSPSTPYTDSSPSSDSLKALLEELVDDDECEYDHDDYCQIHYHDKPCAHERARKMVRDL